MRRSSFLLVCVLGLIASLAEVPHTCAGNHFVVKNGVIINSAAGVQNTAVDSLVNGGNAEVSTDAAAAAAVDLAVQRDAKTRAAPGIASDDPINAPLELEAAKSYDTDPFEAMQRLIRDPCHDVFERIITPFDYLDSISQRLTKFPTLRPLRAESCSEISSQSKRNSLGQFGDGASDMAAAAEESDRRVGIEGAQERVHASLLATGVLHRLSSSVKGVVAPGSLGMLDDEEQARGQLVAQLVAEGGDLDADASVWLRLGNSWRKTGDALMALQCYRKSLALNADNVDALLGIAIVLQNAEFSDDAAVVVTHAVNSNPGGPVQLYIRATVLEKRHQPYAALKLCRDILESNPDFEPCTLKIIELQAQVTVASMVYYELNNNAGLILCSVIGVAAMYAVVTPAKSRGPRRSKRQHNLHASDAPSLFMRQAPIDPPLRSRRNRRERRRTGS